MPDDEAAVVLVSKRGTARVERLAVAMVRAPDGSEGVVRRLTPYGPQALFTDDPGLADELLAFARAVSGWDVYLVTYRREG
jgi:hypothetical protein